jgi:hypothetical protein
MAYGKLLYSTLLYGDSNVDNEQPEYEIPDLMRYLPLYYQESREMLKLQGTAANHMPAGEKLSWQKLRGSGTVTKEYIKAVATAFSGGEVAVIEYPKEYRFEIKFVGVLGIPPNMAGFLATLNDIKPAHLGYEISYTYTVWNMLLPLNWYTAGTRTWSQLRVYGGK